MEPRRLWKRYLFDNLQFAAIVALEWLKQRRRPSVSNAGNDGTPPESFGGQSESIASVQEFQPAWDAAAQPAEPADRSRSFS
jgi:hypothetical protein